MVHNLDPGHKLPVRGISLKRSAQVLGALTLACLLPAAATAQQFGERRSYCLQLEQRLANEWVRGRQSKQLLPKINQNIRKQDALLNRLQAQADRRNCYEIMFIFGRSLRRTRRCIALDKKIRAAKRALGRLQEERSSIRNASQGRGRRDEIIAALARNGCGERYQRESRRTSIFSWFNNGQPFFEEQRRPRDYDAQEIQPFATYRTMCVRKCDGYYFPVSFSTLPSHFNKDVQRCQEQCAAPAELFVYRNPGGEVEQMTSIDGRAYSSLPNAWRYRKEYVKGCSCKVAEFDIDQTADGNTGTRKGTAPKKQSTKTDGTKLQTTKAPGQPVKLN